MFNLRLLGNENGAMSGRKQTWVNDIEKTELLKRPVITINVK